MQTVSDFFNKAAGEIRATYFPHVNFYRDNKDCVKATYAIELFNNGCLTYGKLLTKLSKSCKASEEDINNILKQYTTV